MLTPILRIVDHLPQDAATNFSPSWLESREPVTLHHHARAGADFMETYNKWFGGQDILATGATEEL